MASRELHIDTEGVGAAGATAAVAGTRAAPAGAAVPPCAADATSVQVATRATARIGALGLKTLATNLTTAAAAARLHGDAEAYGIQEVTGTTALGRSGGTVMNEVSAPQVPTPRLPAVPQLPGIPAGYEPTTGHEIATVIHSGPGPHGVLTVAARLEGTAADLDHAATSVSTAGALTADNWVSDAADAATEHLVGLQNSYTGQAGQARALAVGLRTHAEDFARAKAQIPAPQHFTDLETRLQALYAANAHPTSLGRYTAQITDLQHALAAANNDAVTGYAHYRQAAETQAATMDPHGDAPNPDAKPKDGTGPDPQSHSGVDPATPATASPAGMDGMGGGAGDLMSTVLPSVLGAVSGAAGGLLGALSGAGQQLQQVGSQLASGVAKGAEAAMHAPSVGEGKGGSGGGGEPEMPDPKGLGGSGPLPGDTEPAGGVGGAGALAAPASASAVPAAAPATYSPSPSVSTGGAGAVSGGSGMMAPMMPMAGRPGGGGGEDDRRLYAEKRVRVETPPNSEPVKGRREPRAGRTDRGGEASR